MLENDFLLAVVTAPLVYMVVLHDVGSKKMFDSRNVPWMFQLHSLCAAAGGQDMPVELAGLLRGKRTWVIYSFPCTAQAAESPPSEEGSLPLCTFSCAILGLHPRWGVCGGFYSSTMSSNHISATFRLKCWMWLNIQSITVAGKQLAFLEGLAVGLLTKEINEQQWWGRRVRNGLGELGSPLVYAASLRSLGRL